MSTRFLYSCPQCDRQIALVATQAGQNIECPGCHLQSEAPKLGVLRQLPVLEQAQPEITSGVKRALFTIGLAMAVLLGGIGTALYNYASNLIVDPQLDRVFITVSEELEKQPAPELLDIWSQLKFEEGIGEWRELGFARYKTQGNILKLVSYGLLTLVSVGLIMLIGSFLIKGR